MGLSDSVRLSTQSSSEIAGRSPDQLVSEILRTTGKDVSFSALQIVEQHPEILSRRSCVIDLVYEEYHRRRSRGQQVAISELTRPFGNIESSVCKLVEFDQVLDRHPSLLAETPEMFWPEAGDVLCGLRLVETLGRGLFSRVFVAKQELLGGRLIVAKVCLRGRQEANLLGKLNHRAICYPLSISDVSGPSNLSTTVDSEQVPEFSGAVPYSDARYEFSQNAVSVICMEYQTRATLHHVIEGLHSEEVDRATAGMKIRQSLAGINSCADGSLTSRSQRDAECPESFGGILAYWMEELADAVRTAHAENILHCDIKPGNILVLPDMSVQLMDFNLAWSQEQSESALAGGTMPYMSPEQLQMLVSADFGRSTTQPPEFQSENSIGPSTDIWGLCATFWHLITGVPPFGHAAEIPGRMNAASEMLRRQQAGIRSELIARAESLVPTNLCQLLLRGMSRDPQHRILDAAELLREIRSIVRTMRDSDHFSAATETDPAARRRRGLAATLTLTGLVAATLPLAAIWFANSKSVLSEEELASVINDVSQLEALGDVQRAEGLLTSASMTDPRCEPVAVRLALIRLRQGNISAAHDAVEMAADAASAPGLAKYIELFCRCQLLKIPRYRSQQADAELNNQDIEEQTAWVQAREEWKYFLSEPQFRDAAATNMAAMYFESGEPGECRRILDQYLKDSTSDSLSRMRSALVIPEFIPRHDQREFSAIAPEVELLRGLSSVEISRFEAACLINGLAMLASIEQRQTGNVAESRLKLVREAIDNYVPEICEPAFLKPMMMQTAVLSSRELSHHIGQLISAERFRPVNRIAKLLIAPDTLTPVILSAR